MTPALVGCGLVSPLALGVTEHVFFLRASVGAPPPPAFETAEGERVDAWHCGFLSGLLPMTDRLSRMVDIAVRQAVFGWEAAHGGAVGGAVGGATAGAKPNIGLAFVAPRHAGISDADVAAARASAARRANASVVETFFGAAGAFQALAEARTWLSSGRYSAILVASVDSFIHPAALEEMAARKESYWCPRSPPPSEGAAAVLVASRDHLPTELRSQSAPLLGAAAEVGHGNDEDDAILDGVAMTSVFRGLPSKSISLVVGQEKVDDLRTRDFYIARARLSGRFAEGVESATLEEETGRLGAAAGVAATAYSFGLLKHRIFARVLPGSTALVWSVSSDGMRGAALVQGASQ